MFGIFKSKWTRAVENSADFIANMFDLYCGRIPASALRDPYCIGFFQMVGVHVASQSLGNVGSMEKPARAFEECLQLCAPRQTAEIAALLRSLRVEGSPNSGAFLSGRKDGDLYIGWRLFNLAPQRVGQAALRRFLDRLEVLEAPQPQPEPVGRKRRERGSDRGRWQLEGKKVFRSYTFADVPTPGTTTSFRITVPADRTLSGLIYASIEFRLSPYRYMWPDRLPLGEGGEIVESPWAVGLVADAPGAGTEESPLIQGGMFDVWACEEDSETVMLGMERIPDVRRCAQAISTGTELTFTLHDEANLAVKLRLTLPNDQDFARLFNRLMSAI
jgi:hypothetical protein